jgi:dTDP-4-dehydrorhamnose 3,5-epimerase
MKVTPTALPEVLLIEPAVFGDARGYFYESWSGRRFEEQGLPLMFVQDNVSRSQRGILRGLHLQSPPSAQGKLVSVLLGEVYDVAVDARAGSPSFGKFIAERLSAENKRQLYIPPGFAHGFVVTSDEAIFTYKCTAYYDPKLELSVLWNDPALGIPWPVEAPGLSGKDAAGLRLADVPRERLTPYVKAGS